MSIVNAINMGDYALVAVDTEAATLDMKRFNVSKLLTIPHCNAVIACRGSMLFLVSAHAEFLLIGRDFDGLIENAEAVMRIAFAIVKSRRDSGGPPEEYARQAEMTLVGYSEKAGKVVINCFKSYDYGATIESFPDVPNIVSPAFEGEITTADLEANRFGLKVLVDRQVAAFRKNQPGAAAGGRLIIAQVHKESILLETVCQLN